MSTYSKKLFSIILISFCLAGFLASAGSVLADASDPNTGAYTPCNAGGDNPNALPGGDNPNSPASGGFSGSLQNPLKADSFVELITNIADFLLKLAIPVAFFMMVIAGFRFAAAQGNEEKLTTARRNLMYTIIGIAVVFASKILVSYISSLLEGGSSGPIRTFINKLQSTLYLIIGFLFTLVTVYFIWGIIQYVGAGGGEEKITIGKRHMIWGIVGMTIMAAAWPIVSLIVNYIGQ